MTTQTALRDAYYARVTPLFGEVLQKKGVAIDGDSRCVALALLLARCGVRKFAATTLLPALKAALTKQNPLEDRFEFTATKHADVLFAGPGATEIQSLELPALRLSFLEHDCAICARLDLLASGEDLAAIPATWPTDEFDAVDALNRSAALLRAMLMRDASPPPPEISTLLKNLKHPALLLGHARWPWWLRALECRDADSFISASLQPQAVTSALRRGSALIVGCGSLGSAAAIRLEKHVNSMAFVDPERVEIENPVRQEFEIAELGRYKAETLAERLLSPQLRTEAFIQAIDDDETGREKFESLIAHARPDLAILTTGTDAEYMMAAALRRHGVPHIAARCYARARYFEIIAVDGNNGSCFHCLREQIHTGPPPSLTPEQKARYDPDFRPGQLDAEPASIVESGRCADVLSRIAREMLRPRGKRAAWLNETFAQERNCFVGANHAERDAHGNWAHGLDLPGKVTTYGPEDIAGMRAGDYCTVCGRKFAN